MYGSASGRPNTSEIVYQSSDSLCRSRALRIRFNRHFTAWKSRNDPHAKGTVKTAGNDVLSACGPSASCRIMGGLDKSYLQAGTPPSSCTMGRLTCHKSASCPSTLFVMVDPQTHHFVAAPASSSTHFSLHVCLSGWLVQFRATLYSNRR
jgi:hypothetical protein